MHNKEKERKLVIIDNDIDDKMRNKVTKFCLRNNFEYTLMDTFLAYEIFFFVDNVFNIRPIDHLCIVTKRPQDVLQACKYCVIPSFFWKYKIMNKLSVPYGKSKAEMEGNYRNKF